MDYEIFLLTRIRERFLQTNNTRDAVSWGVSTSARTITSAALIMIAVYIGFAFAGHAAGRRTRRCVRRRDRGGRHGGPAGAGARPDGDVRRSGTGGCRAGWTASCRRSTSSGRCPRSTSATWSSSPTTSPRWWRPAPMSAWWSSRRRSSRTSRRTRFASPIPLAFTGCGPQRRRATRQASADNSQWSCQRHSGSYQPCRRASARRGSRKRMPWAGRGVHPVTMWRGRLSVALDALEVDAQADELAR